MHAASPKRIVVTGAHGLLGSELCRQLGDAAIPLDIDTLDLTDPHQVRRRVGELAPQLIINTAAYTRVDEAESEPDLCFAVNRDAVQTLAEAAGEINARLIQLSTDYVFSGTPEPGHSAWKEGDRPSPRCVYAHSKLAGEQAAAKLDDHLIVRTCGLYGLPGPRSAANFVTTILRLAQERDTLQVVDDQVCSPTWVQPLAAALLFLGRSPQTGIFHIVNQGGTPWCDLARQIVNDAHLTCRVVPVSTAAYGAVAVRPSHSVLDTSKYRETGGPPMQSIEDALRAFIQRQWLPRHGHP